MSLIDQLVEELKHNTPNAQWQTGFRHTTPAGTPSLPYYNAMPGLGLWGVSGLERDVFSTRIQPRGLGGSIPAFGTNRMWPRFAYITGYDAVSGSNPTAYCDDPQVAGPMRTCVQTADFGRYSFMTREFDITRVGEEQDRGYFTDLRLVNDPLVESLGNNYSPAIPGMAQLVGRETLQRFVEVGVAFQNKLLRQVYQGNPANDTGSEGYQEFPGLDILIGTGKVDAITGTACAALDSDIKNYNYVKVNQGTGDSSIVNVMSYMLRYLRSNAERMNMDPVSFAFVMRQALFWEITAMWACSYLTYRCGVNAQNPTTDSVSIDARDAIEFRDGMRSGQYLLLDGVQYPVIIDDGIDEESAINTNRITQGCYASDIYIVPLTIQGGMPVTFWQYKDYSQAVQAASDGNIGQYYWTDGGKWFWHAKPPRNWCVQWLALTEPRIVLLTPHLAGRLMNVQYCPLQHERTPFPGDPYNLAGGVSTRAAAPSLYAPWPTP